MSDKLANVIGGAWTTDYSEEDIEKDCQLIFEHAKLRMPHLTVAHLQNDGPGHASNYEDAWSAVGAARSYLQEMGMIYSPE